MTDHVVTAPVSDLDVIEEAARDARAARIVIHDDAITPDADAAYSRAGYEREFAEDVMERPLPDDGMRTLPMFPRNTPPLGVTFYTWTDELAPYFYQLYVDAFRERPAFPNWTQQRWLEWLVGDGFYPDLCLIAAADESPVGFVTAALEADNVGTIIQLGVSPAMRGVGVGAQLIDEALRRLYAAGAHRARLHVNLDNPTAAARFAYAGFQRVARRGRYVRRLR